MKYLPILLLLASFVVAQDETPEKKPQEEPQEKPKTEPEAKESDAPASANPVIVMKTSMGDVEIEMFADAAPKTVENFIGLAEGTKEYTDVTSNEKTKGHYFDGLIFHRVIKDFMIQGGCPMKNGRGSPGYKFENEISATALGLDKKKAIENGRPNGLLGIQSQQQFNQMVAGPLLRKLGIKSQEELKKRGEEVNKKLMELTVADVYANMGFKFDNDLKSRQPERGCLAMANAGPGTNGSQFFIITKEGGTPWLAGKHTVFGKVIKGMDVVDKIGSVKTGAGDKPVEDVTIVSVRLKKAEEPS